MKDLVAGLLVLLIAVFFANAAAATVPGAPLLLAQATDNLLTDAKDALTNSSDIPKAIELLSEILIQPKSPESEEALELLGLAYERSGKPEMAKAKYNMFLKQYPDSPSFQRVRQRLIALEIISPEVLANNIHVKELKQGPQSSVSASTSNYLISSSTSNHINQWHADQTALISNLSANAMYKNDDLTVKGVLKFSRLKNLGAVGRSKDEATTLNVDVIKGNGEVRVGRQTANYGTLGRFDGIMLKYAVTPGIGLAALTGTPYTPGNTTKRRFYGFGIDFNPADAHWSETVYYNTQTVDGFRERAAVGSEFHYFNMGTNIGLVTEYDLLYKSVDSILAQGTFPVGQYNVFFVVNKMKAPILLSDRALQIGTATSYGRPYDNIQQLMAQTGMTPAQVYDFVERNSGDMSTKVIGITRPISPKWTIGTDLQISNIAMPTPNAANDLIAALALKPLTIQTTSYSSKGIDFSLRGNDILIPTDSVAAIANYGMGGGVRNYGFTLDLGTPLWGGRADLLGRISKADQLLISSITAYLALRYNYKFNEMFSLDAQASLSDTITSDQLQGTSFSSYNKSLYLGIRADF